MWKGNNVEKSKQIKTNSLDKLAWLMLTKCSTNKTLVYGILVLGINKQNIEKKKIYIVIDVKGLIIFIPNHFFIFSIIILQ